MQTAKKLLMVRPANFAFNEETAKNNYFQKRILQSDINEKALQEFDNYVNILRSNKIEIIISQDTAMPHTPDSIYPNNWFSTHSTGELVLYPMFAKNRRLERKEHVLNIVAKNHRSHKTIDLTGWEKKNRFLEGTGSLILEHNNKVAFACRSERTDDIVFEDFYTKMNFEPKLFNACDENKQPIYHTNVMLSIGENFAVICSEAIIDDKHKENILNSLKALNKEIIDISYKQMRSFCANILEVTNRDNENIIVMSETARKAFTNEQIRKLKAHSKIISASLNTIEKVGGGSARCMIAEIF